LSLLFTRVQFNFNNNFSTNETSSRTTSKWKNILQEIFSQWGGRMNVLVKRPVSDGLRTVLLAREKMNRRPLVVYEGRARKEGGGKRRKENEGRREKE
jgi:hypothetical protein